MQQFSLYFTYYEKNLVYDYLEMMNDNFLEKESKFVKG